MMPPWTLCAAGAAAAPFLLSRASSRLALSRAKHPSLRGHARIGRWLSSLLPYYEYDDAAFFRCDGAPDEVEARRRAGFERLSSLYETRFARTAALTQDVESGVSDLQFTSTYRVPFPFARTVKRRLKQGAFVQSADGLFVTDLDGNRAYDLTGSYGVNVMGHDFYRRCMAEALERAGDLGVVLGPYHPSLADNVRRLRDISGLEEVSFHMSGTEAVMQAVRLARYHTRRTHLVRFCGAYHGWWGDVQPGVGNPSRARETYTLKDRDEDALHVIRTRKDIACVLVNPLQALHPNANAPGDSALVGGRATPHFDKAATTAWLKKLREICTERGIVLIFDEVFVGFRLAKGGAQEYFGVRADLVTYGKTLGGGLPVGVVCGRRDLMKRYRDDRPADICFARGTFNSHPQVMAAMNAFLRSLDTPEISALYADLDETWNRRAAHLNERLREQGLPVEVANLSTIWTVSYTRPSRYNWMLQFYLKAEGLALSWVGTGRFIFSLNYTEDDFRAVCERFVAAAKAMAADGFFWTPSGASNKTVRRQVLRETLRARFRRGGQSRLAHAAPSTTNPTTPPEM